MRAMALYHQAPIDRRPLVREDRPAPTPGPGEVLVGVSACGVCRTDLHLVEGDLPLVTTPIVPGHQVVGRVERLGPGARRFAVGDRVGIAWLHWTCGACARCRAGRENLCAASPYTGYHADGGFADYAVAPEAFAYAMPGGLDDVQAAPLLCAGIIGYRALRLAAVPSGGRLGIYGFGSSAHVTLQIARARGAEVYVCTREPTHRELARRLGATWTGDVREAMPRPMDGTIVFAPAGDLVPLALRGLDRGGTVALAGIHMSPIPALDYAGHLFQERALRSVTANTRADGEDLLAEAARLPLHVQTTVFGLHEANEALAGLAGGTFAGSGVLRC